ncbi:hypothetical protein [Streptomyces sp. V4I2]|uniref:hypothetical protein n=1 Tax=Streptomyces sp. V4I2 TaxID=3042280 RepID=UPI00277F914E|nr:hypothetical protein [Streptomyces sp. V4I2]MDQ1043984.1 hypothetical protein [Streptomyces sp. V4I2]
MTRRTRTMIVTASVLAAAGLTGGGVALAADADESPRDQVRFVVEEGDHDCPEKATGTNNPASQL